MKKKFASKWLKIGFNNRIEQKIKASKREREKSTGARNLVLEKLSLVSDHWRVSYGDFISFPACSRQKKAPISFYDNFLRFLVRKLTKSYLIGYMLSLI